MTGVRRTRRRWIKEDWGVFLTGVLGTSARVGVGRGDVGGDDELGTFKTSGPGEQC